MEYKGLIIQHVDERKRGYSAFDPHAGMAWVCSAWEHPQLGLQVTANAYPFKTIADVKVWIDNEMFVGERTYLIFAPTKEAAEDQMREMAKKPLHALSGAYLSGSPGICLEASC